MKKVFVFYLCVAFLFISNQALASDNNTFIPEKKFKIYHDSGRYNEEIKKIAKIAKNFINMRASTNENTQNPQKLALVLDIDETVLSNYPYMVARKFTVNQTQLQREISAAKDPVIKPMFSLYKNAIKHNVAVFFVTGRRYTQRQATIKNLKRAGISNWTGLYLKPQNYHEKSIIPFKAHTRKLIENMGYTIIATIGDQKSDINGGHAERGFKLPNPYYHLP